MLASPSKIAYPTVNCVLRVGYRMGLGLRRPQSASGMAVSQDPKLESTRGLLGLQRRFHGLEGTIQAEEWGAS